MKKEMLTKLNLQFFGEGEGQEQGQEQSQEVISNSNNEGNKEGANNNEQDRIAELQTKLAIEDWKKENLQGLIDEAVNKKVNPNETPEQKRIRELEKTLADMKETKEKADMLDGIMTKSLENDNIKMSPEIVKDFVIKGTQEETEAAYNRLNDFIKKIVSEKVEEGVNNRFQRQTSNFNTGGQTNSQTLSMGAKMAKNKNKTQKATSSFWG